MMNDPARRHPATFLRRPLLKLFAVSAVAGLVATAGTAALAQSLNPTVGFVPRLTPLTTVPSTAPASVPRPTFGPPAGAGTAGRSPLDSGTTPSAGTTTLNTPGTVPTTDGRPTVRLPGRSRDALADPSDVRFAPNSECSSYKNFEGFAGRPCKLPRRAVAKSTGAGDKPPPGGAARKGAPRNVAAAAANDFVPNEIIIEIDGTVSEAQSIALAQRHRLTRVESQSFPLLGATMFRWRIPDRRSIDTVSRQLMASGSVKSVQRNYRFTLQQGGKASDAGQYAVEKLHLRDAHALTRGDDIKIAVIDSGVDVAHPELAGVIAGTFDALRSTEGPHTHGTGIAGAIAAHAKLTGSAPAARLFVIRSFGATSSGAESTSFVVLKGLNYAVEQGVQIINMSFAGPKDPLLERGLAAAASRGIVLIAAAGNAGPKSPPLYPAADRSVIAVSATDSADLLFAASNRGNHIALAAPGVDVLLPAPDEKYQVASGTSFAAAYVSGLAALIMERNPGISSDAVRKILTETASDLGPKGKDDQFGAGLADALAAVRAARPVTAGTASRAIEIPR